MSLKNYFLLGLFILSCLVFGVDKNQQKVSAQQSAVAVVEPFMIKDINPGGDSNPWQFTEMDGKIYFTASTEENGEELWVTDGTEAGTYMVKDINPYGSNGSEFDSEPLFMTVYKNELYFRATNTLTGTELWKSDGTEAGTVLVKNIYLEDGMGAAESSDPYGFVEFNGELFFVAKDSTTDTANGLWKTDGTEAGTVRVGNVFVHNYGYSSPVIFGNAMYFNGSLDKFNDKELWKSDGTASGTVLVKDINPDFFGPTPSSSDPKFLTVVNDTLFFVASGSIGNEELWKSDGTEVGTVLVKDIRSGADPSFPDRLVNMNGILYFRASDSMENSYELWRSDGTEAGTYMVKDINPQTNYAGFPAPILPGGYFKLPVMNSELYFYGAELTNGNELWKSDGTEVGTVLVKDIFPGLDSSNPLWFVTGGATLYFTADDGVNGIELWQSDGTNAGTVMVKDIAPGNDSSNPQWLGVVGNWLFFSANDGVHGRELWTMLLAELDESMYLPTVLR
ncbi:MAG: hypothetical protein H6656_11220 [Ardenticatenaceae bacterium]|nr:hypothetical protein [Ardenticatenaceae bacterium]